MSNEKIEMNLMKFKTLHGEVVCASTGSIRHPQFYCEQIESSPTRYFLELGDCRYELSEQEYNFRYREFKELLT